MKKIFVRKTAALIVSLMVLGLLAPLAAFAEFSDIQYNSGNDTVTGTVYVDSSVYGTDGFKNSDGTVTINVYDANGGKSTVDATYVVEGGPLADHYYYEFTVPNASGLGSSLNFSYTSPVDSTYVGSGVYNYTVNNGGNGGVFYPPVVVTTPGTITAYADGSVDASALANLLNSGDGKATIQISGEFAILPASALTKGISVTIVANGASYTLPLSVLNLDELAKSLGVDLANLNIKITLAQLKDAAAQAVSDAAVAAGGKALAPAFEFKLEAVAGDKSLEINNFGQFVSRTITMTEEAADLNQVTGVRYNPTTKELSFVPSTFAKVGDDLVATMNSSSDSIYTVISTDAKSFSDLANHWAKADIEKLAGKLIVEGTGANKFEPKRSITRAEFAAMIVRSLGLETAGTTEKFSDVSSSAWYAGVVAAAANAGIVLGDDNGHFNPSADISRKELAAMVVRAMKYAGKDVTLTDAQASAALAAYTDTNLLGWAKAEVAVAVSTGVVKGQTDTKIVGNANANRAEAATMVIRYLGTVGFIN